jgi:pyruvate kinase
VPRNINTTLAMQATRFAQRRLFATHHSTGGSLIEHNAHLAVTHVAPTPAVTLGAAAVVATIGPASANPVSVQAMIEAGMRVARFNMSHGNHEVHRRSVALVREGAEFQGQHVGLALDTKGPEVRSGRFSAAAVEANGGLEQFAFSSGQRVTVTCDPALRNAMTRDTLFVDYPHLLSGSTPHRILIADGTMVLRVLQRSAAGLECVVTSGALVGSQNNVHLAGTEIDLPMISANDERDLAFAVEHNMDFVFVSFAQSGRQLHELRGILGGRGRHMGVIAKIETAAAIDRLDEILDASDGVMVARGDLGNHVDFQNLFLAQKKIIAKANIAGKPVICATQMLESMVGNPRPTRAETTDVANAVIEGADAVMLSAESARGSYPVAAVKAAADIAASAGSYVRHMKRFQEMLSVATTAAAVPAAVDHVASAAVLTAMQCDAKCIITTTVSGNSVRKLRQYGPPCPIVAVCASDRVARQLSLTKGIIPLTLNDVPYTGNFDALVEAALEFLVWRTAVVGDGAAGNGSVVRGIDAASAHKVAVGGTEHFTPSLHPGDRVVVTCTDTDDLDPAAPNAIMKIYTLPKKDTGAVALSADDAAVIAKQAAELDAQSRTAPDE